MSVNSGKVIASALLGAVLFGVVLSGCNSSSSGTDEDQVEAKFHENQKKGGFPDPKKPPTPPPTAAPAQ
jgi:hypothetical protein